MQSHPPEEMHKMEKIFQALSAAYVASNPGSTSESSDCCQKSQHVYGALLAIIKLNSNLHSPDEEEKMTPQDFVSDVIGTFHCDTLDGAVLDEVYKNVQAVRFFLLPFVCVRERGTGGLGIMLANMVDVSLRRSRLYRRRERAYRLCVSFFFSWRVCVLGLGAWDVVCEGCGCSAWMLQTLKGV